MVKKYTCPKCGKEFSQKSHYDKHQKRKNPCIHEDNLRKIVEEIINQKMKTQITLTLADDPLIIDDSHLKK